MASGVQEHISQGVPDFPRRAQHASMESLGEYRAAAIEHPVERARDAGANGHHAASQRSRVSCFDEEMRVRRL
jgi:hypothetical protein